MSIRKCIDAAVAQDHITREEADQILARYAEIAKQVRSTAEIKAVLGNELQAEADVRRHNAMRMEESRAGLIEAIQGYRNIRGEADYAEAFVLLFEDFGEMGGTWTAGRPELRHAQNLHETLKNRYAGRMAEVLQEFRRGAIVGDLRRSSSRVGNRETVARIRNVVRELFGEDSGDPRAKELAQAWTRVAEEMRLEFNGLGGMIGKLEKWGLPQFHVTEALMRAEFTTRDGLKLTGRDAWVEHLMQDGVLDRERMVHATSQRKMTDAELREALGTMWDRITTDGYVDKEITGAPVGRGAIWKQHADHRFLHFKGADAWMAYADLYGNADPFQSMMRHIDVMSRDIAHMTVFGPNPAVTIAYLKQWLTQQVKLTRPVELQIAAQADLLRQLQQRLTSPNPEYERLTAELASLAQQMAAARDAARATASKAMRDERTAAEARRKHLRDIGGEFRLSDMTVRELRNLIDDPAVRDMAVFEARIRGMRRSFDASYGLPFRAVEYALGGETRFRDPGALGSGRLLNSMTPEQVKARLAEIITANDDLAAAAADLNRIDAAISEGLGKKAAAERARAADLAKRYKDVTDQLIPYWNDPSLKTVEDMSVAARMHTIADDMLSPIIFADVPSPADHLAGAIHKADRMWSVMRGQANIPVNTKWAHRMAATRNILTASALDRAIFSSITDAASAKKAMRQMGIAMSKANAPRIIGTALREALFKTTREEAARAWLGWDSAQRGMMQQARMAGSLNTATWTGYIADRVLTTTLLAPWTQGAKHVFGSMVMGEYADLRGRTWDALPEPQRRVLAGNGFDAASWDQIRAAPVYDAMGGVGWLEPEAIERTAGRDLAMRYALMIHRLTRSAVVEGTVRAKALVFSEPPGTVMGEMQRSMMQFKGYPVAFASLIIHKTARETLAGNRSSAGHFAAMVLTGLMISAVMMALRDVANGDDPRRWFDKDLMLEPFFWTEALLRGVGLGIYGDIIKSGTTRQGKGLGEITAGPLVGLGTDVLRLGGEVAVGIPRNAILKAQGKPTKETRAGMYATRIGKQLAPSHFAFDTAVQRIVWDQIQKMVDPEAYTAFRRQERRQMTVWNQQSWWPAGEWLPKRAPNPAKVLSTR